MTTRILHGDKAGVAETAQLIRAGQVAAIPTETVYGLAADAFNPAAVDAIFKAKGRPRDNPLIVHIDDISAAEALVSRFGNTARILAEQFWPGPLTLVLPRRDIVSDRVTGGLNTVAIRLPAHPLARGVIRAAGLPIAAPSANRSGRPSPTTAAHVLADMDGLIPAILDGGACTVGVESTVLDVTGIIPILLRPGGITPGMLRAAVGEISVHSSVTGMEDGDSPPPSPGMKYRHYAPSSKVILVCADPEKFRQFLTGRAGERAAAMCFEGETEGLTMPFVTYGKRDDTASQAHRLFAALRETEALDCPVIYCAVPREGDTAVYNRLLRAAEFEVIKLD